MAHELVIRGGTVADGTGAPLFEADIVIDAGTIVAVGAGAGPGVEEIDASGMLVTPGFVDIHTHYDGQVTWDSRLQPSSGHGVTTVVTGNCGVGFAPCRPGDHDGLIALMAGVEDIPEVAMTEGLAWDWQSFPDYLDAVERRPHDVDIAAMLPHSALRVFVMGQRAIDREPATPADIEQMRRLTDEALAAGAIGFGTSRALHHRSASGEPIPTVRASEDELAGILGAMTQRGTGVFQLVSDFDEFRGVEAEFAMLLRLGSGSGRPVSFTLNQKHLLPDGWRDLLERTEAAAADGVQIKAQVLGRPTGLLLGHDLTISPFTGCPTYDALAHLPFDTRITRLGDPDIRQRILGEAHTTEPGAWNERFELCDPPDYEPLPADSIAARAGRAGTSPGALAYDILLEDDGHRLILQAFQNYAEGSLDACYEMLTHPDTILGLGDGGAHCGLICDASYPTTMLAFWTRDRTRGPRLDIAASVHALTSSTAEAVGLYDRGRIAPGYKADINIIDYDHLQARIPSTAHDLPSGGRRLVQGATGYVATVVNGVITYRNGLPTGALPGQVVRGPRTAPAPDAPAPAPLGA